jgi:hypothetical protein
LFLRNAGITRAAILEAGLRSKTIEGVGTAAIASNPPQSRTQSPRRLVPIADPVHEVRSEAQHNEFSVEMATIKEGISEQ